MYPYLHTIALEPARWTPARVSKPLEDLLPAIRSAGFSSLEVFEPHITLAPDRSRLRDAFQSNELTPQILSSYLDPGPDAMSREDFASAATMTVERAMEFGCRAIRVFPGHAAAGTTIGQSLPLIADRIAELADLAGDMEIFIETHDGHIADAVELMPELIHCIDRKNVGLLFQPTVFQPEAALAQFDLQKDCIRHVHLQNRKPDGSFERLMDGIIPWDQILKALGAHVTGTIEFVETGIRPVAEFELDVALAEAGDTAAWAESL